MMSFIAQKFIGIINGIEIENEQIYYAMTFILQQIEEKFSECYTNEFIEDLYTAIYNAYLKYDIFEFDTFENNLDIHSFKTFEKIKFNYYGLTDRFEWLNKNIKCRKYSV